MAPSLTDGSKRVAVIGGGLVGCLSACLFAQRGYEVHLYEMRPDIRRQKAVSGRSINLTLTPRGLCALGAVPGLGEAVRGVGLPLRGRMVHNKNGGTVSLPYTSYHQNTDENICVDRKQINEILLSYAEKHSRVTIHFQTKLKDCNVITGHLTLQQAEGGLIRDHVDLIVGCDGVHSVVRDNILQQSWPRFVDYMQEYADHGYIELKIPPDENGEFALAEDQFHIWADDWSVGFGFPNMDRSFTVVAIMPNEQFEALATKADISRFFEDVFPDLLRLIGRKAVEDAFMNLKPNPMISIKCSSYHVGEKTIIMGDAAHAMFPFYGQGANCGLEDAVLLNELLDEHNENIAKALPEFTRIRTVDANAICDLSHQNLIELRDRTKSHVFLTRRLIDRFLHWMFPDQWMPLHTMVVYTRMRYHQCIITKNRQDLIIKYFGLFGLLTAFSSATYLLTHALLKPTSVLVRRQ